MLTTRTTTVRDANQGVAVRFNYPDGLNIRGDLTMGSRLWSTVRAYLSRGQMPPADGHFEGPPWWRPETIKRWRETRRKGGE